MSATTTADAPNPAAGQADGDAWPAIRVPARRSLLAFVECWRVLLGAAVVANFGTIVLMSLLAINLSERAIAMGPAVTFVRHAIAALLLLASVQLDVAMGELPGPEGARRSARWTPIPWLGRWMPMGALAALALIVTATVSSTEAGRSGAVCTIRILLATATVAASARLLDAAATWPRQAAARPRLVPPPAGWMAWAAFALVLAMRLAAQWIADRQAAPFHDVPFLDRLRPEPLLTIANAAGNAGVMLWFLACDAATRALRRSLHA